MLKKYNLQLHILSGITFRDLPSGKILRELPNAGIPAWEAPRLDPYCSPIILLLSANFSAVKFRLFSSATFTPKRGPSNPFFCACQNCTLQKRVRNRMLSETDYNFGHSLINRGNLPCRLMRKCNRQPCIGFCARTDRLLGTDLETWDRRLHILSKTSRYFPSVSYI